MLIACLQLIYLLEVLDLVFFEFSDLLLGLLFIVGVVLQACDQFFQLGLLALNKDIVSLQVVILVFVDHALDMISHLIDLISKLAIEADNILPEFRCFMILSNLE